MNNINNHRMSNGNQACAACKYQRRRCASDCVLAPYFPHDRQKQFLNAHKLFGVSNITKIIRDLTPPQRDIAMRTIMYQSDVRAIDPVGGCYRIIRELEYHIQYYKAELDLVMQQLAMYRAQDAALATTSMANENANNATNIGNDVDCNAMIHGNDHVTYGGQSFQDLQVCAQQLQVHEGRSHAAADDDTLRNDLHLCDSWKIKDSSSSSAVLSECKRSHIARDQLDEDAKPLVDMLSMYGQNYIEFDSTQDDERYEMNNGHSLVNVVQETQPQSETNMFKDENVVLGEQQDLFHDHQAPGLDLRTMATLFTLTS
ncbi:hypothetical protein Droror1_Dr00009316 [Drosera rotundifolia]